VKNVWGLGAAVLSLMLLMMFWTVYVTGRLATTERLAPSETADGIEVPVIGTVGDFPEPERRHVVNVSADGRFTVEGKVISFDALDAQLEQWSRLSGVWYAPSGELVETPGANDSQELSAEHLLLRLDRRLPWYAAWRLIDRVYGRRLFRIWIVVRHEDDGEEAALGFPTTIDGIRRLQAVRGWRTNLGAPTTYGVDVAPGDGGGSPDVVYRAIRALPRPKWRDGEFNVALRVHGALPVGTVLQLWDAVMRSGASAMSLWTPGPVKSFEESVGPPAVVSSYSIWLCSAPDPGPAGTDPMPPVQRGHGPRYTFESNDDGIFDESRRLLTPLR
jgi:hypothetical protein